VERLDYAREVKVALSDPVRLCQGLGLAEKAKRQATGLLIRCPSHGEKDPSCSVTKAPDGTVRVKCFACDFGGDALSLIAVTMGLNTRDKDDFRQIMAEGARIAGLLALESEIRGELPPPEKRHQRQPEPERGPDREYPPAAEIRWLWQHGGPPADDPEVSGYLVRRKIDPVLASALRLVRCLPSGARLPRWARYGRQSWAETGHRMLLRVFDHEGRTRSVRAWRVTEGDSPKRLPPAGHLTAGLVMANRPAWEMLAGRDTAPLRLLVTEGEPDFLTWATKVDDGVIGLISGSWSEAFAARVPRGSEVPIMTHHDPAGDRYARAVFESLRDKCAAWRGKP
jgi:hypothetical protein